MKDKLIDYTIIVSLALWAFCMSLMAYESWGIMASLTTAWLITTILYWLLNID